MDNSFFSFLKIQNKFNNVYVFCTNATAFFNLILPVSITILLNDACIISPLIVRNFCNRRKNIFLAILCTKRWKRGSWLKQNITFELKMKCKFYYKCDFGFLIQLYNCKHILSTAGSDLSWLIKVRNIFCKT